MPNFPFFVYLHPKNNLFYNNLNPKTDVRSAGHFSNPFKRIKSFEKEDNISYFRVLLNVYSRRPVLASKMSPLKMTVSAFVNSAFVPE